MATRRTAAACLGFNEFQGEVPFAEENALCDQFWALSGVHHMAGPAAFAVVLSVDMNIVEVLVDVPEVRGIGGCRKFEQVPVMAAEAKLKFSIAVGHIKFRRIGFDQEPDVRRSMRVVAGGALPVLDGAVKHGLRFLDEILMAVEAEVLARLRQELRGIARVGRMTGRAALLRLNRRMDALCPFELFLDLGMALIAETGARRGKELLR